MQTNPTTPQQPLSPKNSFLSVISLLELFFLASYSLLYYALGSGILTIQLALGLQCALIAVWTLFLQCLPNARILNNPLSYTLTSLCFALQIGFHVLSFCSLGGEYLIHAKILAPHLAKPSKTLHLLISEGVRYGALSLITSNIWLQILIFCQNAFLSFTRAYFQLPTFALLLACAIAMPSWIPALQIIITLISIPITLRHFYLNGQRQTHHILGHTILCVCGFATAFTGLPTSFFSHTSLLPASFLQSFNFYALRFGLFGIVSILSHYFTTLEQLACESNTHLSDTTMSAISHASNRYALLRFAFFNALIYTLSTQPLLIATPPVSALACLFSIGLFVQHLLNLNLDTMGQGRWYPKISNLVFHLPQLLLEAMACVLVLFYSLNHFNIFTLSTYLIIEPISKHTSIIYQSGAFLSLLLSESSHNHLCNIHVTTPIIKLFNVMKALCNERNAQICMLFFAPAYLLTQLFAQAFLPTLCSLYFTLSLITSFAHSMQSLKFLSSFQLKHGLEEALSAVLWAPSACISGLFAVPVFVHQHLRHMPAALEVVTNFLKNTAPTASLTLGSILPAISMNLLPNAATTGINQSHDNPSPSSDAPASSSVPNDPKR